MAAEKLLADAALEEAAGIDAASPRDAMAAKGAAFERLVAIATEEYGREARARPASHEARRVERARRLLAGELVDPSILEYDLCAHHLGLVAPSAGARPLVAASPPSSAAAASSSRPPGRSCGRGSAPPATPAAVRAWLASEGDPEVPIGIGELKTGLAGSPKP